MRLRFILLAGNLVLAGCAVGPTYHRPATGTPETYRGQSAPESATLADTAWWDLYHDPALTTLVRESFDHGFDARIAAQRVESARAMAMEAHGQLFPAVGYGGDAFRGRNSFLGNPYPAGGATSDFFAPFLSAAWEPDIWGRLRRLDEVARNQYLATEEARRGVLLSLLAEVASDYFQLLELDDELAIARQATASFGDSLKLFNQRLAGGVASRLETSSAAAAEAAEAAQVPRLEREIALTENELSVLLGHGPGPVARGAALSDHEAAPNPPAGIPSALLERRPDVRQAEFAAKSTNAQIGATIGSFLPRFGLSAMFGGASTTLQNVLASRNGAWSVGAQVSGPIFEPYTLRGEYLQAKASGELAKLQYEQTALNAFADVSNALVTRQKLGEVRVQQQRAVSAYQDAVKVALQRYKAGEASYYELLQVQQELYPAEVLLAQTQRDELISIVQLYKALGGGWDLAPAAPK